MNMLRIIIIRINILESLLRDTSISSLYTIPVHKSHISELRIFLGLASVEMPAFVTAHETPSSVFKVQVECQLIVYELLYFVILGSF